MAALLAACSTTTPDRGTDNVYGMAGAPSTPSSATATGGAIDAAGPSRAGGLATSDGAATPAHATATRPGRRVTLPGTEAAERGDINAAETATLEIDTPVTEAVVTTDLWQRIRDGFAFPDLPTKLVDQKKDFYLKRPEYLQRMFARGSRYLYHIVEEVERRGMPTELALLPFVESAMNPVALSHAKAAGLWQFIPATGKRYDLDQNWWADNRRDVVKSTDAALEYLQTIYAMHGNDWFLALASYNWGEGAVGRAIRNNRSRGLPGDYLSLRMPTETRHYVPKLIAMKEIIRDADKLGITLPPLANEPYFVTVRKTRPIDLSLAAQFASMSVEDFVALNPAHNRPVIQATEDSMLKIPADRLDGFVEAMARHEADEKVFATWHPYTVRQGETLEDVARRGGVTVAELRRANGIAPEVKVLANTRLLAPQKSVSDDSLIASFSGARIYQQVNVPASHHVVRRGQNGAAIARRYGLTVKQLAAFNGGRSTYKPGQRLVVRHAQVHTVLINENGARQLISSRSAGAAARPVVASTAEVVVTPAATPARAAPSRSTTVRNAPAAKAQPRATAPRRAAPARSVTTRSTAPSSTSKRRAGGAPTASAKAETTIR